MAKNKNNKKSSVIERNKTDYHDNLFKILKILGIVLIMFIIIYIGTAIVTGEIKLTKEKEEEKEVTIQTEKILAGSTFNITDKEYMVLYYDFNAGDSGIYGMLFNTYKSNGSSVKMYRVDLSSGFNKKYITNGKVNTSPSNIDELKVKNPALIRIKNKKVTKFIISKEEIKNYINNL